MVFSSRMGKGYYLVSRLPNLKFKEYKSVLPRFDIDRTPYFVDEVIVGKKNNGKSLKKIITYKTKKGQILERIYDYDNKYIRNKVFNEHYNIIGDSEEVNSTVIHEYSFPKKMISSYKTLVEDLDFPPELMFNLEKVRINHLSTNEKTKEKILSSSIIDNIIHPKSVIHSFIEFPHIINGKIKDLKRKILSFRVNSMTNIVVKNSQKTENTIFPQNDEFLVYRAMACEDMKIPITEYFIKKRGLSKMGISIEPKYEPEDEKKLVAVFDSVDGVVKFNKNYQFNSKLKIVDTARHEVEHGWQYYLHARNTGGNTEWQTIIFKAFGALRLIKLKKEAKKYTKSIKNYVPFNVDISKYLKNLIEKLANKEGSKAKKEYIKQGQVLRQNFPHIPPELL